MSNSPVYCDPQTITITENERISEKEVITATVSVNLHSN